MKELNLNLDKYQGKRNWILSLKSGVTTEHYLLSIDELMDLRSQINRLVNIEDNQSEDIVYYLENDVIVRREVNGIPMMTDSQYRLSYILTLRNGDIIKGSTYVCKCDFEEKVITETTFEAILYKYNVEKKDVKNVVGEWFDE